MSLSQVNPTQIKIVSSIVRIAQWNEDTILFSVRWDHPPRQSRALTIEARVHKINILWDLYTYLWALGSKVIAAAACIAIVQIVHRISERSSNHLELFWILAVSIQV